LKNAVLESCLGFVRKLNEFFGLKSKRPIRVTDYIPSWKGNGWILSDADADLLSEGSMHISLLSAKEGKNQDWHMFFQTYLPKICTYLETFYEGLKSKHPEYLTPELHQRFENQISQFGQYLKTTMPLDSTLMKADGLYSKKT